MPTTDLARGLATLPFGQDRDDVPAAAFASQSVSLQSSVNLDFRIVCLLVTDSPFK